MVRFHGDVSVSTTARGYGNDHQRLRRWWRPQVEAGGVECARVDCLHVARGGSRLILAGEPWDLGHDRELGSWHGPEHRDCNRSEGASFGLRKRKFDRVERSGTSGRLRW